jgi:hypothetical protein
MIAKSMRAMDAKERAALADAMHVTPVRDGIFAGIMVLGGTCIVSVFGRRVIPWLGSVYPTLALLGVGAICAFIVGYRAGKSTAASRGRNPDVKEGVMEVLSVEASRAIRVDEFEDEGMGFYLDVGGGRVLFLQGQYLYDDVDAKRFPCTRFELVRTLHSKTVFSLKCLGEYLTPVHTNPPFTPEEYTSDKGHYDGDELEVPFESLKK